MDAFVLRLHTFACVVGKNPNTPNLSTMADDAITRGSIPGLGSPLYICGLQWSFSLLMYVYVGFFFVFSTERGYYESVFSLCLWWGHSMMYSIPFWIRVTVKCLQMKPDFSVIQNWWPSFYFFPFLSIHSCWNVWCYVYTKTSIASVNGVRCMWTTWLSLECLWLTCWISGIKRKERSVLGGNSHRLLVVLSFRPWECSR